MFIYATPPNDHRLTIHLLSYPKNTFSLPNPPVLSHPSPILCQSYILIPLNQRSLYLSILRRRHRRLPGQREPPRPPIHNIPLSFHDHKIRLPRAAMRQNCHTALCIHHIVRLGPVHIRMPFPIAVYGRSHRCRRRSLGSSYACRRRQPLLLHRRSFAPCHPQARLCRFALLARKSRSRSQRSARSGGVRDLVDEVGEVPPHDTSLFSDQRCVPDISCEAYASSSSHPRDGDIFRDLSIVKRRS